MDRNLIQAWELIEKRQLLEEKQKRGKVSAVKASPKAKTTAIKKLKEEGEMVVSGDAAPFKQRLGKKVCKEDIKVDATKAAQDSINKVKTGTGTSNDATVTATLAKEEDAPALDTDPHAEGPEAAAAMDQGAEEAAEDVSVDAETAEQVIAAIQQQYPGAVITLSVQLPEDTPFDTDLVAAAQEVAGDEMSVEAGLDAGAPEAAPEAAPEEEKPMLEKRKMVIAKTRKQIKEMFSKMEADELAPEAGTEPEAAPVAPEAELAPEAGLDANPEGEVAAGPEPEVEVGDTKIALTPEQWGQVLATTDLLNGDEAGVEPEGEVEPEAGGELPAAGEDEGKIDELKTEWDLSDPHAAGAVKKLVVGPEDKAQEKKADVQIKKPAQMSESFNRELADYANSLKKMMRE
jgi:hypothetical protein